MATFTASLRSTRPPVKQLNQRLSRHLRLPKCCRTTVKNFANSVIVRR